MTEKDPMTHGKNDWLNYTQKRAEVKENKELDKKNQEDRVKVLEKKKEEKKGPPKAPHNPNGGIQLG